MRRPREWTARALSALYDLSSEYGYNYVRALVWFCIVQVVSAVTYAWLSRELVLGGRYDSRVVAFTFAQLVKPFELFGTRSPTDAWAYQIFQADSHLGWWLTVTALQSVLSIALIALFLLALRWQFRRG